MDRRITLPITRIDNEAVNIKTFWFKHSLNAQPGQFIMITDFDGGEKPFSLSICENNTLAITVKKIGEFTNRLFQKNVGDLLSIRGAYGSSFFISDRKVLLIGGGCAVPTFYFLCKELLTAGAQVTLINGAIKVEELIFNEKFSNLPIQYQCVTDDGSAGKKGTAVDVTNTFLEKQNFDFVYASGPELMLKALKTTLKDQNYEFLLERYMKCAVGICGSCTVDPLGIRLCVEGPVLDKSKIEQLTEFGNYHRDATGKRIEF